MAVFRHYKFGDVISKIVGGGTPSKKNNNYWNGSIHWASVKDFSDNKYYLDNTEDFITEEGLINSASNLIPKGTVIIPTRMGLGRVVKTRIDTAINQDLKAIFPNETVDNNYLLLLIINLGRKLQNIGNGSTVSGIRLDDLKNIEISVPDISEQREIASIVFAYNDLIENNEKRIKILEEMTQRLYEEWFIKFKFPGHEKVKMIDSPPGKIPEGWEVVIIEDLLDKIKRKPKIQATEYLDDGLFPVVDQGREFIAGFTENNEAVYDEDLIVFGDHTRVLKYCNFPFACGADGTQLLKSKDMDRMPQILLYYVAKNAGLQNYQYARHFKFLKALKVLKPDSKIAQNFENIVAPRYELILKLNLQNKNLEETRDLLIPQLVTGKRELKN